MDNSHVVVAIVVVVAVDAVVLFICSLLCCRLDFPLIVALYVTITTLFLCKLWITTAYDNKYTPYNYINSTKVTFVQVRSGTLKNY